MAKIFLGYMGLVLAAFNVLLIVSGDSSPSLFQVAWVSAVLLIGVGLLLWGAFSGEARESKA